LSYIVILYRPLKYYLHGKGIVEMRAIKKVYNIIPFKRELFSLMKMVYKPKKSVYKHLHFKGVIKVDVGNSRNFKIKHYGFQLENEIFWNGLIDGWEKESIKLWLKLCERSDIIFDVGANTGIYSLVAKAVNPCSTVYAFEPVERVFEKLHENIALNNYNITAIKKALSDKDGSAIIYDTSAEHVYSVTVNKNLSAPETNVIETKIETVTLNSFIKDNNIPKIDLIKIDVETHEPEVLEGFSDYLSKFRPVMLIEILTEEVAVKVNAIVEGLGYLYFNIDEKGGIRQTEKITISDYYNFLLCNKETAEKLGLK
jgi:FkbM family methyltransferase